MSELPSTLGRYRLVERISVGGMAEIFRAKAVGEVGFEKEVAIKRILPHMASDREFIDMFIDEAKTVAQLSHANICQIFEFGHVADAYFIAMELVEGRDLKELMSHHRRQGKTMPLPAVLYIIGKTCEALDYAHHSRDSAGEPMSIVHRDVSPQNVLVSFQGTVKLIDFGIAKAMGRLTKTQAGSIKGKFSYMSPEQVSAEPVDHRSDIFACGTVLWECLTNQRLFKGDNEIITMTQVRKAEVRPPSEINPEVPSSLDPIVLRALARDVGDRYQTAGEFLDDLEDFALRASVTYTQSDLGTWLQGQFPEEYRRVRHRVDHPDEDGVVLLASPKATSTLSVALAPTQAGVAREPSVRASLTHGSNGPEPPVRPMPSEGSHSGLSRPFARPVEGSYSGISRPAMPTREPSHSGVSKPAIQAIEPSHSGVSKPAIQAKEPSVSGVSRPAIQAIEPSPGGASRPASSGTSPRLSRTGAPLVEAPSRPLAEPGGRGTGSGVSITTAGEALTHTTAPASRRGLFIGLAALLLLLVGGGLWLFARRDPGPSAQPPERRLVHAGANPGQAVTPNPDRSGSASAQPDMGGPPAPDQGATVAVPGAAPPAGVPEPGPSKPGTGRPASGSGSPKEDELPDFNYIPPGSVAVKVVKIPLEAGAAPAPPHAAPDPGPKANGTPPAGSPGSTPPEGQEPSTKAPTAPAPEPAEGKESTKPPEPASSGETGDSPRKPDPPPEEPKAGSGPSGASAAAPQKGYLAINSKPWAQVWINGQETGRNTPIPAANPLVLPPGTHEVTLFTQGKMFNFKVSIKAGETHKMWKELPLTD